jgi:hypothetical protein
LTCETIKKRATYKPPPYEIKRYLTEAAVQHIQIYDESGKTSNFPTQCLTKLQKQFLELTKGLVKDK